MSTKVPGYVSSAVFVAFQTEVMTEMDNLKQQIAQLRGLLGGSNEEKNAKYATVDAPQRDNANLPEVRKLQQKALQEFATGHYTQSLHDFQLALVLDPDNDEIQDDIQSVQDEMVHINETRRSKQTPRSLRRQPGRFVSFGTVKAIQEKAKQVRTQTLMRDLLGSDRTRGLPEPSSNLEPEPAVGVPLDGAIGDEAPDTWARKGEILTCVKVTSSHAVTHCLALARACSRGRCCARARAPRSALGSRSVCYCRAEVHGPCGMRYAI